MRSKRTSGRASAAWQAVIAAPLEACTDADPGRAGVAVGLDEAPVDLGHGDDGG